MSTDKILSFSKIIDNFPSIEFSYSELEEMLQNDDCKLFIHCEDTWMYLELVMKTDNEDFVLSSSIEDLAEAYKFLYLFHKCNNTSYIFQKPYTKPFAKLWSFYHDNHKNR